MAKRFKKNYKTKRFKKNNNLLSICYSCVLALIDLMAFIGRCLVMLFTYCLRLCLSNNQKKFSIFQTKQLNTNDLLDINDLLKKIDDFYKNKKTPLKLIHGVVKESKNNIYLHSNKDINKNIRIENIDPKMLNQDVIIEGQLIQKIFFKHKYFVLKINNWLLKQDINKYNLQKKAKITKIMKIGILASENNAAYSDIQGILKEKNYKSYKKHITLAWKKIKRFLKL